MKDFTRTFTFYSTDLNSLYSEFVLTVKDNELHMTGEPQLDEFKVAIKCLIKEYESAFDKIPQYPHKDLHRFIDIKWPLKIVTAIEIDHACDNIINYSSLKIDPEIKPLFTLSHLGKIYLTHKVFVYDIFDYFVDKGDIKIVKGMYDVSTMKDKTIPTVTAPRNPYKETDCKNPDGSLFNATEDECEIRIACVSKVTNDCRHEDIQDIKIKIDELDKEPWFVLDRDLGAEFVSAFISDEFSNITYIINKEMHHFYPSITTRDVILPPKKMTKLKHALEKSAHLVNLIREDRIIVDSIYISPNSLVISAHTIVRICDNDVFCIGKYVEDGAEFVLKVIV